MNVLFIKTNGEKTVKEGIYSCSSYLLLIGIALWIVIDLSYGRIVHLRRVRSRSFPLRQSDFHLYTYGKDLYDTLFTDIKQAKHHVHVLFFIVKTIKSAGNF